MLEFCLYLEFVLFLVFQHNGSPLTDCTVLQTKYGVSYGCVHVGIKFVNCATLDLLHFMRYMCPPLFSEIYSVQVLATAGFGGLQPAKVTNRDSLRVTVS